MLATIVSLQKQIETLEGRQLPYQAQAVAVDAGPAENPSASARFQELKAAASAWNIAGDKSKARMFLQQAKDLKDGKLTLLPPKPEMPGKLVAPPMVSVKAPRSAVVAPSPAAFESTELREANNFPSPAAAANTSAGSAVMVESKEMREAKNALERLRSSRALRRATNSKKWDDLLAALSEEARRCNSLAMEFKETEKKLAVDCFRRQKECLRLLEQGIELKNIGCDCPSWQASLVFPIRRVVMNSSLTEEVMAVSVLRGGDVASADGKPISTFVKILYSYHPSEGAEADTILTSSCLSPGTRSPEWNFMQLLPIQRKKSFQKWLERKDLRIELWESKVGNSCSVTILFNFFFCRVGFGVEMF